MVLLLSLTWEQDKSGDLETRVWSRLGERSSKPKLGRRKRVWAHGDPTALMQGQRPHHPVASVWAVTDGRDSVEDLGEASVWGRGSSEF